MDLIQSTELWKSAFGQNERTPGELRFLKRLEQSFVLFRDHALQFARHLTQDLRQLTVHDETHTDALWEIFDVLFPTEMIANPLEAYVLGGAFLVHDLGHALCLYPGGVDQLRSSDAWKHAQRIKAVGGGSPQTIIEHAIRLNHAAHAKTLVEEPFSDGKYLIDDYELRSFLGRTIGQVAFSHWWDHKELNESPELVEVGAIPIADCPSSWTVHPRKLGYVLRVCDACHLDGRRAPIFIESLRKPTGVASHHWGAQRMLAKPYAQNGQICFTSMTPFHTNAIDAWWTAYDLIQAAAIELSEAEHYFSSHAVRPRVNRAAGSSSPRALARFVRVEGWEPIDARPKITAVTNVISHLGGEELYGNNLLVPIRELIQNSRDAVVARRNCENKADGWGAITVKLDTKGSADTLTVTDTGIGMSERTMVNYLLDFGSSYWESYDCINDHPALDFQDFTPVGKFGIGFFAIFMLGAQIKVASRTSEDTKSETRVLEFDSGIGSRPILRRATSTEQLDETGTEITIQLSNKKILKRLRTPIRERIESLMDNVEFRTEWTLAEALAWCCPACDVNINVAEDNVETTAVVANDWISMQPEKLFRRLFLHRADIDQILRSERSSYHLNSLEPLIAPNGEYLGRASLIDNRSQMQDMKGLYGVVTCGPFRTSMNFLFAGLLLGSPTTAARNSAEPIAFQNHLVTSRWATKQAYHATKVEIFHDLHVKAAFSAYVRSLCGDMFDMNVYLHNGGVISLNEAIRKIRDLQRLYLFPLNLEIADLPPGEFDFNDPTHIGVTMGRMTNGKLLNTNDPEKRCQHPLWNQYWYSLWGAAIEAISIAWTCDLSVLLEKATDINPISQGDRMLAPAIIDRPT